MSIKILCAALVLIPTCIAVPLFYLAHGLFCAARGVLAMLCMISGFLLLVPVILSIAVWLVLLRSRRTEGTKTKRRSVCP